MKLHLLRVCILQTRITFLVFDDAAVSDRKMTERYETEQ